MRVDWCYAVDAAVAATARSEMGRTTVASGTDDTMDNGLDEGTGEEAEGFPTIVLPKLGGREVSGSNRLQGRDSTPGRSSTHVVGFSPPQVTSQVVPGKGKHLTMVLPKLGGREVRGSKRC